MTVIYVFHGFAVWLSTLLHFLHISTRNWSFQGQSILTRIDYIITIPGKILSP